MGVGISENCGVQYKQILDGKKVSLSELTDDVWLSTNRTASRVRRAHGCFHHNKNPPSPLPPDADQGQSSSLWPLWYKHDVYCIVFVN
jgi:hypothetical protein